MANPIKDMTGQVFGYLTVTGLAYTRKRSGTSAQAVWYAQCQCGNTIEILGVSLRHKKRGKIRSCGCKLGEILINARQQHGMSGKSYWVSWAAAKARCTNPLHKDWANYGGRGITFSEQWLQFENFWRDMGPTYKVGLTLDRIDVNGPYSVENCRWATMVQQSRNRRTNIMLETPLGRMTIAEASEAYGVGYQTLYKRLKRGWEILRALTPPKK